MSKDHKKLLRELKRQVKKDGNRSRRRHFQRELDNNPEIAHEAEYGFNQHNTSTQYQRIDGDKNCSDRRNISEEFGDSSKKQDVNRDGGLFDDNNS